MVEYRLNVLAAGAALSLGIASLGIASLVVPSLGIAVSEAAAGCCPALASNCACAPVVVELLEPEEIYLVNQGPVFSGPGHSFRQVPDAPPADYPYVGPVFTGYPYGLQNSGGYPRGSYSPFTGYPYAEPLPPRLVRRHIRAYPRYVSPR